MASNLLVGNPVGAAGLEIAGGGLTLQVQRALLLCLGGGDLQASLDGQACPRWVSFRAQAGATLRFGAPRSGFRAYLAVAGGLALPSVLGSRSPAPGESGRLQAGERLAVGPAGPARPGRGLRRALWPDQDGPALLRVLPGPGAERELWALRDAVLTVHPDSNRMGLRLRGSPLGEAPGTLPSLPVAPGGIQQPPGGELIALLADGQTLGGYRLLGQIISADQSALGQLRPGQEVLLAQSSLSEARQLAAERRLALRQLAAELGIPPGQSGLDSALL
jgi:antagonist of KipI